MSMDSSDLYNDLIERHKDDPKAIMDEYNEKYRDKERFIRYGSMTLGVLSISTFLIGLYTMLWAWNTIESMLFSIPIMLVIVLITIVVTYQLMTIADSSSKFSELSSIKRTFEKAYIDTLYPNQFERIHKTAGLRSKSIRKRYYSRWKLFNNPET